MSIKWVKGEVPGRIGVQVPYNQKFNDELRVFVPSAKFDRYQTAWLFDEEAKPDVLAVVERFYANLVWKRVTFEFNRDNPTIDGARMMSIQRDWWKFSDGPYKYTVVEESLSSGGSRANPGIYGRLVIDIHCREGVEFYPEPESVEEIADPTAVTVNPLEIYPDDMLVAELARRGHALSVSGVEAVDMIRRLLAAWDGGNAGAVERIVMKEMRRLVEGSDD